MKLTGTVLSASGPRLVVDVGATPGCSACSAREGCHGRLDLAVSPDRTIEALNALGAKTGNRVVIEIPESRRIGSVAIVFGLPVLLGVAGGIAGSRFGGDLAVGLGGAVGLALGIAFGVIASRRARVRPRIVRVLGADEGEPECESERR